MYISEPEEPLFGMHQQKNSLYEDGSKIWQAFHPEDLQRAMKDFADSGILLTPVDGEYRMITKGWDGFLWKRIEATPEAQNDGSSYLYGNISSIEEQKQNEKKCLMPRKRAKIS